MMKKAVIVSLLSLFLVFSVSAQSAESGPGTQSEYSQTIELDEGWNTVAFQVSDINFEEDLKPQCSFGWYNSDLSDGASEEEIDEDERYYVWSQEGGEWSHPNMLSASAYSFYVTEDCELQISGDYQPVNELNLEPGWNLERIPPQKLGKVVEKCSLRWYNSDLSEGVSEEDISEERRYYFWVNNGGEWENPWKTDYSVSQGQGVYVNVGEECSIEFSESSSGGETEEASQTSDIDVSEVERNIVYSRINPDWDDLSDRELATLAGVPEGRLYTGNEIESDDSLAEGIEKIRDETSNGIFHWQDGYESCADYNPEDCSSSGKTYFVSSVEGWVFTPGTPAPHCYAGSSETDYVPPKYSEHSEQVSTDYADTDENKECPGWLSSGIDSVESKLGDQFDSATGDSTDGLEWTVIKERNNPEVGYTYKYNYKVADEYERLNGAKVSLKKKHESEEEWTTVRERTCEEDGDSSKCYIWKDDVSFDYEGDYTLRVNVDMPSGPSYSDEFGYDAVAPF